MALSLIHACASETLKSAKNVLQYQCIKRSSIVSMPSSSKMGLTSQIFCSKETIVTIFTSAKHHGECHLGKGEAR